MKASLDAERHSLLAHLDRLDGEIRRAEHDTPDLIAERDEIVARLDEIEGAS